MESGYVLVTVNFSPPIEVDVLEDSITYDIHRVSSVFDIFISVLFKVT
jgi:hypothetical protein